MSEPRSIFFVCTMLEYGGAQTQIYYLSSVLKRRGWDITVVSMRPIQALQKRFEALDVKLVSLDMPKGIPDPRALFKLAKYIKEVGPHIVHCHMYHANILGRLSRILYRFPVLITTAHNIYEGGKFREIAYRVTDFLTDLTTNVCQPAVARYIRHKMVNPEKMRLVYNGINLNDFSPKDRNVDDQLSSESPSFVWIAIGSFTRQKHYENMLNAFVHVKASFPAARLQILGGGEEQEKIENICRSLDLSDVVTFFGKKSNIKHFLDESDGYVMSSQWEGLPIVLLETAAMELPIVCTDVGGNSEIVIDGKTGYLVEADNPNELFSAMERLMNMSSQDRKEMGRQGRLRCEKEFDIEHVASQWEVIYSELHTNALSYSGT